MDDLCVHFVLLIAPLASYSFLYKVSKIIYGISSLRLESPFYHLLLEILAILRALIKQIYKDSKPDMSFELKFMFPLLSTNLTHVEVGA